MSSLPKPTRFPGDGVNDARCCVTGTAWAAWDLGGRTVVLSSIQKGSLAGAGYTRGGGERWPWRDLDEQSLTELFAWVGFVSVTESP